MPRTLFGRSLLIIVTPFILLQVISAYIFYERHWDTISRYLAVGLVGDINAVIGMLEAFPEDDDRAFVVAPLEALVLEPGKMAEQIDRHREVGVDELL